MSFIYALSDTRWVSALATYNAIWMDVNDGASGTAVGAAASRLIKLTNNTVHVFSVDLTGNIYSGVIDTMVVHGVTSNANIQVNSDSQVIAEFHTHSSVAAATCSIVYGARSRGTTASPTIVANNDIGLYITAVGYDGTDYEQLGYISFEVDGTPGDNDMPGRIVMAVTPDGGTTPATAATINNDKSVNFAGSPYTPAVTVTALPSASVAGQRRMVNNSGTVTFNVTCSATASGGAIICVFSDGTQWKVG